MRRVLLLLLCLAACRPPELAGLEEPENGRCPVTGQLIPQQVEFTVRIRGRAYAVCCEACVKALKAHPERYLDEQGEPR